MQDGEVWLTQDGIAQLFDVDRSVVTKHLKNFFQDGELAEKAAAATAHHNELSAQIKAAEKRMAETYRDQTAWNRMSLHNIARSGIFSADRSVADYADTIWHVPYKK